MTATQPATAPDVLRLRAAEDPQGIALVIDGERRTWAQLEDETRHAAAMLRAVADPRPGDRVGILMQNSVAWVAWAHAISSLGCVLVPLNTRLRGDELSYQLRHSSSVAVVVAGDACRASLDEVLQLAAEGGFEGLPSLRRALVLDGEAEWATPLPAELAELPEGPGPAPDEVLLIQYTSGTTAYPKGVMLSHRQVLTNARGLAGRLHVDGSDRVCSPSPFVHVAGTTLLLYLGLVTGATVVTFGRFDPETALEAIEREGVTVYNGVETFFIGLMKHPSYRPERVARVRTGWIAASKDLTRQVQESGFDGIVNVYGISECSPNVTVPDADEPARIRRTCGRPHSGTEIRIVDEDSGEPLEDGRSGLIEVRGPCVMKGYLDDPEQTAATVSPEGWLSTGDRGRIVEGGNLVYEGRFKDMLRVGGENVSVGEIEAVLLSHEGVSNAAVVGVPHDRLIEVPAAVVEPKPGMAIEPEQLSSYVAERLASFKVPRRVVVVDELPMTGSGKVQKHRLAELVGS